MKPQVCHNRHYRSNVEEEGGKCIGGYRSESNAYWVTPLTKHNRTEKTYAAYGNEADLRFVYEDLCLIVKVKQSLSVLKTAF